MPKFGYLLCEHLKPAIHSPLAYDSVEDARAAGKAVAEPQHQVLVIENREDEVTITGRTKQPYVPRLP